MKSKPRLLIPSALILVIGLATAFVVLVPEPDMRIARSEDGRIEAEGIADAELPIVITPHEGTRAPRQVIDPSTYTITLAGQPLPAAFTIRMLDAGSADTIFGFDDDLLAWRPLSTTYDSVAGTLEAEAVPSVRTYATGVRPALSPPAERGAILSALVAGAPPGAVGFEAADAVAFAADEFILLGENIARGGCNGRFAGGKSTTMSTREMPLGDATYRIMIRWELDEGCPPFAPITISN